MKVTFLKYLLADLDIKQIDISTDLKIKPQVISAVINGHDRSKTVENHIAACLGKTTDEIFPLKKKTQKLAA